MKTKGAKPSERIHEVTENANKLTTLIGLNFLTPKFKYSIYTRLTIASLSAFFFFTILTIITEGQNNWKNGLKHSVMLGTGSQALAKLVTGLFSAHEIQTVIYFCREIYKFYEDKGVRYFNTLNKSADRVEYIIRMIRSGYLISFSFMGILPLIFLAVDGSRFLAMQYHIPGFDVNTNTGYFITFAVHSVTMVIAGFGLFAGDLYVLIFLSQTLLFADILTLKVEDLNELLLQDDEAESKTEHLRDIVKWHQLYMKYTSCVNDLFYLIVSVQVLSSAFSITVTLFIMLTTFKHIFFYFYLLLTGYNMIVYCVLGTKIEFTNDGIYNEMCNISWYKMNVSQRKTLILVLMQCQNPNNINILGIMPLSVSTALKITKLIYSMSMMIIQFVEN